MVPFKSLIQVSKASNVPIFLQISDQLGQLIRKGTLTPGQRLPGSRQLAALLMVNRQTVVAAYEEGLAQGWLESRSGSGTYVATHVLEVKPQTLTTDGTGKRLPVQQTQKETQPGYSFETIHYLVKPL